ncbi:MAG: flagellar motor switch protein FliN [Spirochaetota bacterium]|nr:flagellar motor switch protein FliN [Spirochaetota bacterium]
MNESTLSQQEIDALLTGTGDIYDDIDSMPVTPSDVAGESVNTGDLSTLLEVVNYILQIQTSHLSDLYQREISFSSVKGQIKESNQIRSEMNGKLVQIRMDFNAGVLGENTYILKIDDILRLAQVFNKQSGNELSDITLNALSEGFDQMMTSSNSLLSQKLGKMILVDPPQIDVLDDSSQIRFPDESQVLHVSYILTLEDSLPVMINQLLSIPLAIGLINLAKSVIQTEGSFGSLTTKSFESPEEWGGGVSTLSTTIRPIKYRELPEVISSLQSRNNIGLLLDINMHLTVELGRTKMQIKKILGLGEGSIIELEKLAGEPVDLLVNEKLIAKGEVVVIDENFGVRITEIVSPHERLEGIIPD